MMIEWIFNAFIPVEINKDVFKSDYAKNLVGACIISIFASPAYAILYYVLHFNEAAYAVIFNEVILLLPLIIIRYFHSLIIASMVFVASLFGLLTWLTYSLGGLYSATAYWLILPPLIAAFIGGMRLAYLWCLISAIAVSCLYYMEYTHYSFPISPISDPLMLQYLAIFGLNIIILSLVYFYEMAKKSTLANLRNIAYKDILTDLPNRVAYNEMLETALRSVTEFSVIVIDIDNFKKVNAVLGQETGDHLLNDIAQRIKRHLHQSKNIARVGGDEFKMIVYEKMNEVSTKEFADILMATLKIPYHIKGREISITVSMGVATCHANQSDNRLIERYVELALMQAKRLGGNNYQYFTDELAKSSFLQIAIEQNLPNAIINNELSLDFQLIFNTAQPDKITGFEILLRWNSQTLGDISPSLFIPIAERIDFIEQIDQWTLREASRIYMHWYRMNLVNDEIPFAVNISAQHLYADYFLKSIQTILDETGVPPGNLLIEITETSIISDQLRAIMILQKLNEMGIQTLIDDFGVGHTSLSYLTMLPISRIKIDKSFIDTMLRKDNNNDVIVRSIIELAHDLNLKVIAEGVETVEQLNYLRRIGCDAVQGFYLSKPFDLVEMQAFLENYKI
jgi:diguanylate cyclase (GGDEF)-like protein